MQCDEYREGITADPSESFAGGGAHAAECPSCSAYRAEVRALDARIAAALALDVPPLRMPELPAAGNDAKAHGDSPRLRRPGGFGVPAWIGLAAAVAVAAVFAVRGLAPDFDQPPLADQVLAHMDHEKASRQVTSVAVSERRLGRVLDAEVTTVDLDFGVVSYAQSCVINGNTVPHLVVQGRTGPVTLILLPDEQIDGAIPLQGDNVRGIILPVGDGSVAIVGQREEQLNEIGEIGKRVVGSVTWSI